jgi:flagellar basal body-associated protein FliL
VAKKAQIDLLDIPAAEIHGASSGFLEVPEVGDEARADERTSRIRAWIRRLGSGRLKVLLILVATILLVSAAAGGIGYWAGTGRPLSATPPGDTPKTVMPAPEKLALFDHFVVDIRDKKGDIRIAFCDVAVELEHPRVAGPAHDQVEVRQVIHAVLKKRLNVDGMSSEVKEALKIELKNELNRLLGEKAVKNIYMTRYEVI